MSFENPENIIRSWNVQTGFATGPVVKDALVPQKFGRIRTNFICTWREEKLNSVLDFGQSNFSIYLPESLRVLKECYLKIEVPQAASALKAYPGLYFIKSMRLLSAGQEVYVCDYFQHMVDHMQQMEKRDAEQFGSCYLGFETNASDAARTVILPLLLPNSPYLLRGPHGEKDLRGHGVWPAYLGQNRLEIQLTMNTGAFPMADTTAAVPSISGKCSIMYRECTMTPANLLAFGDARGKYSVINRRFTELTSGWQQLDSDTEGSWNINQPSGVVTEVQIIAVADEADEAKHTAAYIRPSSFKITADAIVQKDLDTPEKVDIELYENGFDDNADFPQPGRLCFAAHCCDNSHQYSGGYNMQLASTITYNFKFPSAVRYKLVAVQLQRVRIDALGRIVSKLD